MKLEIIKPDKNLFEGEVTSAIFPGSNGSFGVLQDHAAMISTLQAGTIVLTTTEGEKTFDVKGGVVEVLNNKVLVLAE